MNDALPPVIKWSGSKSAVASSLAAMFPKGGRFFDPFVGGGSLLPFRTSRLATAGDALTELISLWALIRDCPSEVAAEYASRWARLQSRGHSTYYEVRESFNESRSPHDLLFLSRTCVNGLIRFNSRGQFNNSFHHTRPGMNPATLDRIVHLWSKAVQGVDFVARDYRETLEGCRSGDFVFLDPPYENTKGRYQPGGIETLAFAETLRCLTAKGVRWMLTYDGSAGSRAYQSTLPRDVYRFKTTVATGLSTFSKVMERERAQVTESVYLNFKPPRKTLSEFLEEGSNPTLVGESEYCGTNRIGAITEIEPHNCGGATPAEGLSKYRGVAASHSRD